MTFPEPTGPPPVLRFRVPLTVRRGPFIDRTGRTVQRSLWSLTVMVERRETWGHKELRIRLLWPWSLSSQRRKAQRAINAR